MNDQSLIMKFRNLLFILTFSLIPILGSAQSPAAPNILVKDGQKVVFFGDEMTQAGWDMTGGYVKLVVSGLDTLGIKIVPVPEGKGGTSREMLARLDSDVINAKPDWVLFSSGFSDVWNHAIELDAYKKNVTAILDRLQAAGIKVMLLTPAAFDPPDNDLNPKLAETSAFLVQIAKERNLPVADVDSALVNYVKAQPQGSGFPLITSDNIHPNATGSELIAQAILQAMGATPDQMAKVEPAWLDAPGNATVTGFCNFCVRHTTLGLAQYMKLKQVAAARKMSMFDLENAVYLDSILEALEAHGNFDNSNPDGLSNEADPYFTKKIEALIQ
jgi:lysophospholipase L1-like esterase